MAEQFFGRSFLSVSDCERTIELKGLLETAKSTIFLLTLAEIAETIDDEWFLKNGGT